MPSSKNLIQSLRSAHDPHFKLEGRVGGLEKGLGIEVAKLHKTLSKSFAMQRKTLTRVLGLEGRVSELESQQAAEEQAKEGIDDLLGDILGKDDQEDQQEEVGDTKPEVKKKPEAKKKPVAKKKPAAKKKKRPATPVGKKIPDKKPVAKKKKISAESLKKGTSLEPSQWFLDETARREKKKADEERHARNAQESAAGEVHQKTVQYKETETGLDQGGEHLSNEERIKRFKLRKKGIKVDDIKKGTSVEGAENVAPNNEVTDLAKRQAAGDLPQAVTEPPKSDSPQASPVSDALKNAVKAIAESVDRIKDSLIGQGKVQEDAIEDARKSDEEKDAKKKESGLEKFLGPVKAAGEKILKPFKSMLSQVFDFLTTILFGRIAFKLFEWLSNPANTDKIISIFRFIKDWWPLILGGIIAFLPGLLGPVGLIIGTIALVTWGIIKITDAIKSIFGFGPKIDKELKSGSDKFNKDIQASGKEAESKLEPGKEQTDDMPETGNPSDSNVPAEIAGAEDSQAQVQNLNKGGEVQGSGDKDIVPAMLTPGEFVMSKGAVEQYGVNTLEGMNAAAGGTNIPTVQKGGDKGMNLSVPRFSGGGVAASANGGTASTTVSPAQQMVPGSNKPTAADFGLREDFDYDNPEHREEFVEVISPSMKIFMDNHNAILDSDPEFHNENTRLYMDRDGKMPDFGRTVANMSEWAVNESVRMTQENESIPPEVKKSLIKEMMWIRKEMVDNPNFKGDIAFDINKDMPGTAANRIMMAEQEKMKEPKVTTWREMEGEGSPFSADDIARLKNKNELSKSGKNFNGGGLVQGLNGGGLVQKFNQGGLVSNNSRIYSTSSNSTSNFNGGGLVQKFNQGGIVKLLGNKAKGAFNFAKEKIAQISSDQKPRVDHLHLDPPKRPASKAAAAQVAQSSGDAATVSNEKAAGLPPIDASTMRSQSKIRTLGLSV